MFFAGEFVLDIAYTAMQLFHTEPDQDKLKSKLDQFYNGYASTNAISAEEKQLLPLAGLAIWIFYLGVQSQRFDNWSNIFLSKNYLKHYLSMAKAWMEYNQLEIPQGNQH